MFVLSIATLHTYKKNKIKTYVHTWYKITHAGTQVALRDIQTKGRSSWPDTSCFVLEVPVYNLHISMCDSVPCDLIMQRARLSTPDKIVDHSLVLLFEDELG